MMIRMTIRNLTKKPKCEDGRACKGENDGYILKPFLTKEGKIENKIVCGECLQQARRELMYDN